jgi:uncharacterized surface protein with fasciclin (FAS1) repeats|tara:strand:+ start:766 stop:1350 length:585 start_codon:yes stop_codon:yes gene_type:complete
MHESMMFRAPRSAPAAFALALALGACAPTLADDVNLENVAPDDIAWIGETPIYPNATIAQNIASAEAFSKLAGLVERAELAETLGGAGPLTIFAPNDAALVALPPHTDEALRRTLAYHVIPGRIDAADLAARIAESGGSYEAQTLSGDTLTFRADGADLVIVDGEGSSVRVTMADLHQANGIMHVIDGLLLPAR